MQLPLGDPVRAHRQVVASAGSLVDTRSGKRLEPLQLARQLSGIELLLVGEEHGSRAAARAHVRLIQALRESGRTVVIGIEMLPASAQPAIDRWLRGALDEPGFLRESNWRSAWGYDFSAYRPLFATARSDALAVVALSESLTTLGRLASTTPRRAGALTGCDANNAAHRELFSALLADGTPHRALPADRFEKLFRLQCARERALATAIRRLVRVTDDSAPIVVAIVGRDHVAYSLGIARQLTAGGRTPAFAQVALVKAGIAVQASYADYLWAL